MTCTWNKIFHNPNAIILTTQSQVMSLYWPMPCHLLGLSYEPSLHSFEDGEKTCRIIYWQESCREQVQKRWFPFIGAWGWCRVKGCPARASSNHRPGKLIFIGASSMKVSSVLSMFNVSSMQESKQPLIALRVCNNSCLVFEYFWCVKFTHFDALLQLE